MEKRENTVIRVRSLEIGKGMPKIIVPLTGATEEELVQQARRVRETPGVDAVEWRADCYDCVEDGNSVTEMSAVLREILGEIPLLFTFRTFREGGIHPMPIEDYYALNLTAACSGKVDLVDVEISTADDIADHIAALHSCGVTVIGSKHDFDKTPADEEMAYFLEQAWELGADIPKLAVMPGDRNDTARLMNVTARVHAKHARPVITMAMSELGQVSRVTGELFGSSMTFGTVGEASAPGQIPVKELKERLERFHAAKTE